MNQHLINMATFNGSGKYVKLQSGRLSFGVNSTQYGQVFAITKSFIPETFYGIQSDIQYLKLTNLTKLCIARGLGFTGTVQMYSYYYSPYNSLIWDSEDYRASNIRSTAVTYRFVRGIMVGTV